jgi:hypothetical protein
VKTCVFSKRAGGMQVTGVGTAVPKRPVPGAARPCAMFTRHRFAAKHGNRKDRPVSRPIHVGIY